MTPPATKIMGENSMGIPCKYEKEIMEDGKGIARIEEQIKNLQENLRGAFAKIGAHIESSKGWRLAIFGSVAMVFIQILLVAYYAGKVTKTVELFEEHVRAAQSAQCLPPQYYKGVKP